MKHKSPSAVRGPVFAFAMVACWSIAVTVMSGCGHGGANHPSAKIEGAVTVSGKPLADGLIMFMPQQAGHAVGVKAAIKDGCYVADKVPLGKVLVLFNAVQETGRMIESKLTEKPQPERIDIIPAKYRSGVPLDVTTDKNDQNFDL